MSSPAFLILFLGAPTGADESRPDAGLLRDAKQAGYDGALIRISLWEAEAEPVAGLVRLCSEAGLRVIADVELGRFPVNHPLVEQRPEAFAVRREGGREAPVDPRNPMPVTGTAIARLRAQEHDDLFAQVFVEQLTRIAARGVGGFRFTEPERIGPTLLRRLAARLREERGDLQLIADGWAREDLSFGSLDYRTVAIGDWDLRSASLFDALAPRGATIPVLCELDNKHSTRGGMDALRARLRAAAALAQGVIIPIEFLSANSPAREAALDVPQLAGERRGYAGAPARMSSSAADVTTALVPQTLDVRTSERALLVMVNATAQPQALPDLSRLGSVAAVFRATPAKDDATSTNLSPGEVRLLKVDRASPIRIPATKAGSETLAAAPRLVVEDVEPSVGGGDFAVKRVVGDVVKVAATVFADGHEQLAAELHWRARDAKEWSSARMDALPNDRWTAEFPLERLGAYEFVVEGWLDRFGGFRRDLGKKLDAGVAQKVDHAEGRTLVEEALRRCKGKLATALKEKLQRLEKAEEEESAALLLEEELTALMDQADDRPHSLTSAPQRVDAERIEARFSSWYELFPRSITSHKDRHGTFTDVIGELPRIRSMGFDTLYFPPIHPIGKTNRKGPNNTLTPGPDDPGSPYAIGSAEGGHAAIHPELGSFADFDRLVAAAREHGLEIALDFAIQASPDHPWLEEHPGWFAWRPDGTMKYAENPPKKYQDIVNVDFYGPDAVPSLWEALRDVVLLWVEHGVKTFRVDNPHTKPLPFWEWMIAQVRSEHPDVIFLSEAFTRPTMMYRLAKVGFSQSYTYFTWRDRKQELIDYITELTTTAPREFYRPHLFVNTPDINPFFLQTSGRPGFRIRAVLAATLSGLWGVYSGFELCESEPLGPGKEEYLDSEKFEIRPRPHRTQGDIVDDIALLNRLRRTYPALQTHLNTRFYLAHNDDIIWYAKPAPDGGEMIMVMVNLDPHHAQECDFEVPLWEFGIPDEGSIAVEDLVGGHRFDWHGKFQHIRIAPDEPYRIWRLSHPGGPA